MTLDIPNLVLNLGISFVAALAGAYAGARAATHWQEKREDKQRDADKEAAILKAMILCRHFAEIANKIKLKITSDKRKLEWYEVNIVDVTMSPALEQDTPALLSHLGRKHGDLVESLIHAEWVARSTFAVSRTRDNEYRDLQKFLIEKNSPQKITKDDAVSLIGDAWAAKLDSLTKELHAVVDAAIEQNRVCHNDLLDLLPEDRIKVSMLEKIEPTI